MAKVCSTNVMYGFVIVLTNNTPTIRRCCVISSVIQIKIPRPVFTIDTLLVEYNTHPSLRFVCIHQLDHLGHLLKLKGGHMRLDVMFRRELNRLPHIVAC